MSKKSKTTAIIAALIVVSGLSACGQKGALYLPQRPAAISTINTAPPATTNLSAPPPASVPTAQ